MAAADKLWFELGVRDEISGALEKLMRNSENLANALSDDAAELKNVYRNIVDISNVYDKIYVAQKRISALKGATITPDQKKGLKDMSKELEDIRKQFAAIFKDPDRLLNKGEAQFDKMRLNVELMIKDSLRYIDGIEEKDRAEAKNAANESKRIEDLKSKYYELQQYRKQLSDAIVNAAPGSNLVDATSIINGISSRMSAVKHAERNGGGMPASANGADYENFLRRVKAEMAGLTGATDDYNNKLQTNKNLQAALNKLGLDAESQRKIASIREQVHEYAALDQKMRKLAALQAALIQEEKSIANGNITPTYTKERVNEELNAIQRRYNESLAAGKQMELNDALAKEKKAASTRKAMEAVSMLAHVNEGLISSYNRVAEAGSQANRITIQFQNQIGAYAGLYGLERLLKSVVTIGGQFEIQHVALENILGDVQQANILFGQFKELAIESPKTFMELTSYAKQLSAYQIPANELYDTTKRLADMSSGLGVDMNRLILAYGQVRSAAVLRGQELRQFTEAGIPMVQALADKFTQLNGKLTTTADVFKLISARAVPFEMVKEVLWDMTSQGGQFFNMQEELANTLYGKWQKLQDSWQIMLGSIAEGTNATGFMFKWILDIVVALTQNLDKMVPLLSAFGAAKGIKVLSEGLKNTVMTHTGSMAIKNMELAKIKEANRLERERLWTGRQLSATEQQLVQNKNRLVSSDYQILALENQISAKKAHQLMLDGQMSKQHFYRYLQMQGYTREQRKQISLGNLQALQTGPNPSKIGVMGHLFGVGASASGTGLGKFLGVMGGWVGVAVTLLGTITTIYEVISQSDERLNDLANSISGGAEQNANQLANTLKNVENSADEPYKKIEALEEALLGMGTAGKQVVQDSRGFDDTGERLKNLTENAKAYQEALEAMGTPQGKSTIKEALDKSDINDEMEEYEDLQNAEYKRMAALERYSAKYQQMIDAMKSKHKELNDELTSNNLYENIRKLLTGGYANEAVGYFASNTPWGEAITDYAKAVEESEEHLNNIKNRVIPDAMDMLKSLARQAGVDINKSYEELTEIEKTKLRTIATDFANGLEKGSQDAKDSVASWVAQGFYAQLYLTPVINTNELTGLPYLLDEWQKGKGYGLWSKNDLKEANTDFLAFSKKQSQRKVDLQEKIKNYDAQLSGSLLDPDLVPTIKGQRTALQNELDQLNDSLKDGQWVFDKTLTKGGKSGGSKKDTQLEALKNRIDLYKKFFSELENTKKIYGEGALEYLKQNGFTDVFSKNQEWNLSDVTNYRKSLDELTKGFNTNTEARLKFVNSVDADKVVRQRKDDADAIKEYVTELQRMMKIMADNYQVYKKWVELTGDTALASSIAGVTANTTYADYLKDQLSNELSKSGKSYSLEEVIGFDLSEATKKLGESSGVFAAWEAYRDETIKVNREETDKLFEATKNLMTTEKELAKVEKEIAEYRTKYGANDLRTLAKEKQYRDLQAKALEESEPYLKFYSGIMAMTATEAEKIGTLIKENLVKQLSDGTINADKYLKSVKNIDQQLAKIRSGRSNLGTFFSGGLTSVRNKKQEKAEADLSVATIQIEQLSKKVLKAREDLAAAEQTNNEKQILAAKIRLSLSEQELESAKRRAKAASDLLNDLGLDSKKLEKVVDTLGTISGAFDGVAQAAQQVSDMLSALGNESGANTWSDISGYVSAIGSPIKSVSNVIKSAMSGDVGGIVSNAVGIVTSPITALAQLHDRKLDRAIQKSQREVKKLGIEYSNIESKMERVLGGIYTSGGYNEMLQNLQQQRNELQLQYEAESEKKKSDEDKLIDYQQQIKEMSDTIKYFAQDFANTVYSIDVSSWARDLTDAVVSAWINGENAAQAFRDKVKDIVKDLTKNVLTQKIMEAALQPVLDSIVSEITAKEGKLDEGSIERFAKELDEKGGQAIENIVSILDKLKARGLDLSEDSNNNTASSSIKSVTENTADILASYINAIRADVSVNKATLMQLLVVAQTQTEMPVIAKAQLEQLEQIARNTLRNAEATDAIYKLLHSVAPDGTHIKIK